MHFQGIAVGGIESEIRKLLWRHETASESGTRTVLDKKTALADGSVRIVSNSIDAATYRALMTRAGGEVVGEF